MIEFERESKLDQIIKSIEQLPAPDRRGSVDGWTRKERRTEKELTHKHTLTIRQSRARARRETLPFIGLAFVSLLLC